MSGKNATYATVKHTPSKKPTRKEKTKEQLIYTEVKTVTPQSNQTKITRTELHKEKGSSVPFPWLFTVVILGIFCFLLLLTTGILGFMVFQGRLPEPPLVNGTQENSTSKTMTLKEKPLNTGKKCKSKWSCCGQKCYYFSDELTSFEESKKICKEMGSTLLKIEDEEELNFIQSQLSYFYWIGLSRKGTGNQWTWEDKSRPFLKFDWKESDKGHCASIKATKISASNCSRLMHFICEKWIACLAT
ncbi:natural killer cells antigen CD94-like isoform X2 [Cervus elaphus]|uniref:natural killer cells antigen CD94-like isoform X2 n=1 Tax=Cervus canadensis TaxID=1574408 RepID=UPI001CA31D7A|nr:natural killer cells antigen CD94-like isoform X2 [Cervus canadensis]XP_043737890.1 natural killer cells antigen CD94-like isoform X2 [Cervus elaphus]